MAARETGKQRVNRIDPEYFKQPNKLERGKRYLAWAAAIVAIVWAGSTFVFGSRSNIRYSHGPVAAVHATWESQCAACHDNFVAVRDDAWGASFAGTKEASSKLCQTCHAGPPHSNKQIAAEVSSCASCHQDHRGRDASLLRMGDQNCTNCHQDLTRHCSEKPEFGNVSSVAAHPPIRSLAQDPRNLKFSHRVHLAEGLKIDPDSKQVPWTLDQLHPSDRARYERYRQDNGQLKLDCAACHSLDSSDAGVANVVGLPAAVLPARAAGAYMLPISYENQCRACHPLNSPARSPVDSSPDLPSAIPHRQTPAQLHQLLADRVATRYLTNQPQILNRDVPRFRPLPHLSDDEVTTARSVVDSQVAVAENELLTACKKCHVVDSPATKFPSFKPVNAPQVWFKHARFDHAAHRAVSCTECHGGVFEDDKTYSDAGEERKLLIPKLETCVKCHSPSSGETRARFDCVECHRYHGGSGTLPHAASLQGIGAASRDAAVQSTIETFLSGDARRQPSTKSE